MLKSKDRITLQLKDEEWGDIFMDALEGHILVYSFALETFIDQGALIHNHIVNRFL